MTGKTSTERARKSKQKTAGTTPQRESDFGPYPGYWTELIQLYDWPRNWEPQSEWGHSTAEVSQAATKNKEERQKNNQTSSIYGISKKADESVAAYRARAKKP